jgi:WD40 repeat protein
MRTFRFILCFMPFLLVGYSYSQEQVDGYLGYNFSDTGEFISTSQQNGTITIREIPSWKIIAQCIFRKKTDDENAISYGLHQASCVCFEKEKAQRAFFYCSKALYVWDWKTKSPPTIFQNIPDNLQHLSIMHMECSANGEWLSALGVSGDVMLLPLKEKAKRVHHFPGAKDQRTSPSSLAFSKDSASLYFPRKNQIAKIKLAGTIGVPETLGLSGDNFEIDQIAFCPNRHRAASCNQRGEVFLWNLKNGTNSQLLPNGNPIMNMSFSHDGALLAVEESKGIINVWGVDQSRQLGQARGPESGLIALGFTPNRKALFGVGEAAYIHHWEIHEEKGGKEDMLYSRKGIGKSE